MCYAYRVTGIFPLMTHYYCLCWILSCCSNWYLIFLTRQIWKLSALPTTHIYPLLSVQLSFGLAVVLTTWTCTHLLLWPCRSIIYLLFVLPPISCLLFIPLLSYFRVVLIMFSSSFFLFPTSLVDRKWISHISKWFLRPPHVTWTKDFILLQKKKDKKLSLKY